MSSNLSLEPLANQGKADGSGIPVTPVSEVGAMSNRSALSITDAAQQITMTANKNHIEIQNTGTENVYLGGSGVDSTDGQILYPEYLKTFSKVKSTFSFYAVCASGKTSTLRIAEYI